MMNQDPTQEWDSMLAGSGEDFASFLDFGDLNFSTFADEAASLQHDDTDATHDRRENLDESMGGTADGIPLEGQSQGAQLGHQVLPIETPMNLFEPTYHSKVAHYDHMGQTHHRLQQHNWHAPSMVPPTPNSLELQAGHLQYFPEGSDQHRQQQMYEQYCRLQKNQMNFTPLISPAVTPIDTQLRYSDAMNDAFSPLTSPALSAQPHANRGSVYGSVRRSDTSSTTSPLDPAHEAGAPVSISAPASTRRSRRKMSNSSAKTSARSIKQSPAMKPQHKKKQASSTTIPPKEVATIFEQASMKTGRNGSAANHAGMFTAPEAFQVDSVSPESLSEILMPPPATPQSSSTGRSPRLGPATSEFQAQIDIGEEPATPASLMRIRKQPGRSSAQNREAGQPSDLTGSTESSMDRIMEDLVLPEAATAESAKSASQSTDTRHAAVSTPGTANASAINSASVSTVTSPSGPKARKGADARSMGREPKKRFNAGSEKASPALRPKISPSIKPLLPEGASVSAETSALLLASKSNYQNILEGTHFPGVSYPENLSTNLTSKRTSHKIAEQGRRNRINTALQEIALLLPPTSPSTLSNGQAVAGETRDERAATMANAALTPQQQSNSKASTVEAAIEYIKSLQNEVRECKDKLAEYEKGSPPRDAMPGRDSRVDAS